MSARERLAPILEILLAAIAKECKTTQDYLSLEIEQVALAALYEAMKIGDELAHARPTSPPPRTGKTDPQFTAVKSKRGRNERS
jgi:hypothetical protein